MADFVNPVSLQITLSAHSMPPPWVACSRTDALAWSAINPVYRKWVVDRIEEMTAQEKADADAAMLTAMRDAIASQLDQQEDVIRAFMLTVLDELNSHADKINAILTAIDNGANIGAVKANILAIADYPQRTATQLRNAMRGKLGL